jgi:hypothetical protein
MCGHDVGCFLLDEVGLVNNYPHSCVELHASNIDREGLISLHGSKG